LILVTDPVDGTSVALHRGDGYGTAVAVLHVDPSLIAHVVAAAIAVPTGYVVDMARSPGCNEVELGIASFIATRVGDETIVSSASWSDMPAPGEPDVVSVVAAKPDDRALVRELCALFESAELTVYTQGGNPIAPGLLFGELGGVVVPKPPRLHDAV